MAKPLKDMTLEELWALFPIVLTPHNPEWAGTAREEIAILERLLAEFRPKIHHIGSTAIPDIWAKPIIDLLVEIPTGADTGRLRDMMENNGYICMGQSETRLSFNKGYTPEGFAKKVFHVHVHPEGDNDEIFFCDYLRANPEIARQYEELKLSLLPEFKNDRDGYTRAKSTFVSQINKKKYMNDKKLVVGIGEILWDILPEGKKLGGAPANFAYHVSQFGLSGCAVSAVGNDDSGREILEILTEKHINHEIAVVPYPTGSVMVEVDAAGIPRYEITENVAWDNIPFTPELQALAECTQAVCFGSLAQRSPVSRRTINAFIDAMGNGDDTLKVFDINLRQDFYEAQVIEESMNRCNILKINDEELEIVSQMFDLDVDSAEKACQQLIDRFGLKILILTCGVNGSYVFTKDETSFQTTPRVEVADTVGAGDSFTASFISALLKGKTTGEAHSLAVRTSAFVCSQKGAMPVLPPSLV